ncbi:MAG: single-stranded DNA-binding protein [Candidatus Wildermuthbacteria bacterium]|nr:single-stranded DNA-binding protein [Candidatus Wildermuthbacteria bacterium]
MNVNKVILVGRVTDAPETRTTPGGQMVCNLRLATNRVWKDASGPYIEGRLETRSWQDQTGVKKYRTEIIGENLQLGPKPGGAQAPSKPQAQQPVKEEEIPIIEEDGEIDVKDIPF